MSRIFVTGDVHGNPLGRTEGKARLGVKRWPEQKFLTDDDFLVFLGDFGVLWRNKPDREEVYKIKWLDKKNCTNLVIGGNHENWDRLRSLDTEFRWGAEVGIIGYRTFFIPNGSILDLGGFRVFVMGGAMSTDREHRVEGISWWPGEIPSNEEMDFGVRNLEKVNWEVDYVFSHTMPSGCAEDFISTHGYHELRAVDPTARYLQFIAKYIKCKGWFCGHFHKDLFYRDVTTDKKVRCVFHDVLEITKE